LNLHRFFNELSGEHFSRRRPLKHLLVALILCVAGIAHAQTPSIEIKEDGLKNESEITLVDAKGNSVSNAFGAKQQNAYMWDGNVVKGQARYFSSTSGGVESARNWDLALRYERELTGVWSVYVGQGLESDTFAGFERRFNSDVGGRYTLQKSPEFGWFLEAGYRFTDQHNNDQSIRSSNFGRLYTEAVYTLTDSSSTKLWLEYLPNFSHNEAYLANAEFSLNATLSALLSLKVGYLLKYNNEPPAPATQYLDRLLTTSLIAKF
jgi:putative salt-induced outer membrane protein